MDFSKIQEARKLHKSLGNEEELKASFRHIQRQCSERDSSPTVRFLVTFVMRAEKLLFKTTNLRLNKMRWLTLFTTLVVVDECTFLFLL